MRGTVDLQAGSATITLELNQEVITLHGREERPLQFVMKSADHAREAFLGSLAAMTLGLNELAELVKRG